LPTAGFGDTGVVFGLLLIRLFLSEYVLPGVVVVGTVPVPGLFIPGWLPVLVPGYGVVVLLGYVVPGAVPLYGLLPLLFMLFVPGDVVVAG